ncbi:MAG: hypothetical protein HY744_15590 [Deltaproteobacteria bacterium]|nr:hypothetical protein [Deltaproteobacteria bacterium]
MGGAAEVVLVGSFESSVDFGGGVQVNAGSRDGYVARFGSDGKHLWSKRFGDAAAQDCRAVAVDAGGNAVVAGDFAGSVDFGGGTLLAKSSRDLFVAKLDPAGKHLWSKRFGASGEHAALAVASDPKGAVLVTGWVKGAIDFGGGPQDTLGHQSLFALKLGPDGSHIWSAIYGGDAAEARGLAVDGSGNAVLAGRFEGSADFGGGQLASKGGADIFVAKLDASGKHLFSQRFGESDVQEANAVAVGPSGSIVVAGAFQGKLALGGKTLNSGGSADVLVAALAPDGKVIWGNGYGGPSDQIARAVTLDSQGLVLVAGELQGKIDFGGGDLVSAGQNDAFLAKLGPDGKHLWSKRFGFGAAERANAVAVDGSGHPVLAGIFAGTIDFGGGLLSSMGGDDIFLARFDP